ncbi:MAG: nucleotidyltransferase family protein [Acidobacteria bacterium]|nr:nucleotidyltransferase family protein [Acidobacteriota bacterium]
MTGARPLAAVVPAAGRSHRMGREKVFLPFGGSTFLEAILRTLGSEGVRDVAVVLRPDLGEAAAMARDSGAGVLFNPDPDADMAESIRIGLDAVSPSAQAIFIWPADHPAVARATIAALSAAGSEADIWIPTWKQRRGHPALLGRSHVPGVFALRPGEGLRELWHGRGESVRELAVPDSGVIANIDTPEQYEAALRDFPGRGAP